MGYPVCSCDINLDAVKEFQKTRVTILYSGGLDSFILWQLAQQQIKEGRKLEVNAVWYDIGQKYAEQEKQILPRFVDQKKVDWLEAKKGYSKTNDQNKNSGDIFIPGRNAVLAMLAISQYMPDEVWMGTTAGEDYEEATDKNRKFQKKFNKLAGYVYSPWKKPTLEMPLLDMQWNKTDMVEKALEWGVPEYEIQQTYSCHNGNYRHCGKCKNCFRRFWAFEANGLKENWETHPLHTDESITYVEELLDGKKSKHRFREVIPHLARRLGIPPTCDPVDREMQIRQVIHNAKKLFRI